jgi:hypothetical protein
VTNEVDPPRAELVDQREDVGYQIADVELSGEW